MVRRSTPQRVVDDRAFPVRVKIVVPGLGLGKLAVDTAYWLQENLPRGDFAFHSAAEIGPTAKTAFYFRRVEDAQRFLDQFPMLELADGTLHGYSRKD